MLDSYFRGDQKGDTASIQRTVPWVEKYRPASIEQVVAHSDVVATLRKCLSESTDSFPNLLFYGPPGTGKTSTIIAACRQLFQELYSQRVLELNASDDRGIQVVREKIKSFAQLCASSTRLKSGQLCPPFKMIILDEADAMTSFAQAALRRTMELESKATRFCLICNYVSKIIEPIISRCMRFRFRDLPRELVNKQLRHVCENEAVNVSDEALDFLVTSTDGDLRKAINNLQSASRMLRSANDGECITLEEMKEALGTIPDDVITNLLSSGEKSVKDVQAQVKRFLHEGYAASQLLRQLQAHILSDRSELLTEDQLTRALEKIAIVDKRLLDGASEYLQLLDLFSGLFVQA